MKLGWYFDCLCFYYVIAMFYINNLLDTLNKSPLIFIDHNPWLLCFELYYYP